jgi:YggT family protein
VPYDHPIGRLHRSLDKIVMPVVLPLRRVIPPIRLGGIALDVSVIVIFIALNLISRAICG